MRKLGAETGISSVIGGSPRVGLDALADGAPGCTCLYVATAGRLTAVRHEIDPASGSPCQQSCRSIDPVIAAEQVPVRLVAEVVALPVWDVRPLIAYFI